MTDARDPLRKLAEFAGIDKGGRRRPAGGGLRRRPRAMDRSVGIHNIFNPRYAAEFDPNRCPPGRAMYEQVKAEIAGLPPLVPTPHTTSKHGQPPTQTPSGQAETSSREVRRVDPALPAGRLPGSITGRCSIYTPANRRSARVRRCSSSAAWSSHGKIAEMKTGEGRRSSARSPATSPPSSTAQIPSSSRSTTTSFQRDRDFPFFRALGADRGRHPSPGAHAKGQDDDVPGHVPLRCHLYGTTAEFGFDYLRQHETAASLMVQRVRQFAIVDEVDST